MSSRDIERLAIAAPQADEAPVEAAPRYKPIVYAILQELSRPTGEMRADGFGPEWDEKLLEN
jgi:hypothetical protein